MNVFKVVFTTKGRLLNIPARDVREVHVNGDTFTYDPRKRKWTVARGASAQGQRRGRAACAEAMRRRIVEECKRIGRVLVVNNSGKKVEFIITGLRDPLGNDVKLDSGRSKSKLEMLAGILKAVKDKRLGGSRRALRWDIEPDERAYLVIGEDVQRQLRLGSDSGKLCTSKVQYTLRTADGSRHWSIEKTEKGADFIIPIESSHLHTPVLASVGRWHLEQDIWYTEHEGRTPDTAVRVGEGYYHIYHGERYTYHRERRAGAATAWAEIENLTDKPLKATLVVEFHFTDWAFTHQRATGSIMLKPKQRTKVSVCVWTRALFGNRKATSVHLVDITTKPQ